MHADKALQDRGVHGFLAVSRELPTVNFPSKGPFDLAQRRGDVEVRRADDKRRRTGGKRPEAAGWRPWLTLSYRELRTGNFELLTN
jgi:hypothetical protein